MKYLFTALATIIAVSVSAQDSIPHDIAPRKNIKERLALPAQRDSLTTVNATVQVAEQGDAATIVEKNLKATTKAVSGYRIVIFMNNTQTARRDALSTQENFGALFPEEQSYLSYENPYFKVAVGNCSSQEEAITLLGRVQRSFPKAFIMRENINVEEFTK